MRTISKIFCVMSLLEAHSSYAQQAPAPIPPPAICANSIQRPNAKPIDHWSASFAKDAGALKRCALPGKLADWLGSSDDRSLEIVAFVETTVEVARANELQQRLTLAIKNWLLERNAALHRIKISSFEIQSCVGKKNKCKKFDVYFRERGDRVSIRL